MSAETDIYDALSEDATLDGIVDGAVYPNRLPDDAAAPAVGYWKVDGFPEASGFRGWRFQIDYIARTYTELKAMRDALLAIGAAEDWILNENSDGFYDVGGYHQASIDIRNV